MISPVITAPARAGQLRRERACLREEVARRPWMAGGMGTDDAQATLTNRPRHQPQRWVEKYGRSIKGRDTPQTRRENPPGAGRDEPVQSRDSTRRHVPAGQLWGPLTSKRMLSNSRVRMRALLSTQNRWYGRRPIGQRLAGARGRRREPPRSHQRRHGDGRIRRKPTLSGCRVPRPR